MRRTKTLIIVRARMSTATTGVDTSLVLRSRSFSKRVLEMHVMMNRIVNLHQMSPKRRKKIARKLPRNATKKF
jgi:hypothetical protein